MFFVFQGRVLRFKFASILESEQLIKYNRKGSFVMQLALCHNRNYAKGDWLKDQ